MEVGIELQTPASASGRGIEYLMIQPNRIGITRDNVMNCTGDIPEKMYTRLIKGLNTAGFIFQDNNEESQSEEAPFSLKVIEFSDGKPNRSNTVYWTEGAFPNKEVLLILNEVRRDLRERGSCRGILTINDPCYIDSQCASRCCKENVDGRKVCMVSSECRPGMEAGKNP
ncbi:MAG: hypothetical protein C4523_04120 [Myxococcales bacterium]|nr:MAG: hypothetical protein C4523_04120 [Myxococcales bacterium]